MGSILRDASGCSRELKLGIEKQILCQKCCCYIISKTGKKIMAYFRKVVLLMKIINDRGKITNKKNPNLERSSKNS